MRGKQRYTISCSLELHGPFGIIQDIWLLSSMWSWLNCNIWHIKQTGAAMCVVNLLFILMIICETVVVSSLIIHCWQLLEKCNQCLMVRNPLKHNSELISCLFVFSLKPAFEILLAAVWNQSTLCWQTHPCLPALLPVARSATVLLNNLRTYKTFSADYRKQINKHRTRQYSSRSRQTMWYQRYKENNIILKATLDQIWV